MNKEKLKKTIALYNILIIWMIMNDTPMTRILLSAVLMGGISIVVVQVTRAKNLPFGHYGFTFVLLVISAIVINIVNNSIIFHWLVVIVFLLGMATIYRTCYVYKLDFRAIWHICDDIFILCFFHIKEYVTQSNNSMVSREKRLKHSIATVIATAVLALLLKIASRIDVNFAYYINMLYNLIKNNLPYIAASAFFGIIVSAFLYSFIYGLLEGTIEKNPNWYFHNMSPLIPSKKLSISVRLYFNIISLTYVLNIVVLVNILIILVNIYYYLNLFGVNNRRFNDSYYSDGFIPMLINIFISCCLFYLCHRFIAIENSNPDINEEEINKCQNKSIFAAGTSVVVFLFASARYYHIIYKYGITANNYIWFKVLVVIAFYLFFFLRFCFKGDKNFLTLNQLGSAILGVIFISIFIWNINIFPSLNTSIFFAKLNNGDLINYNEDVPIDMLVVSEQDINIAYMEEASVFAIPSLVKLLDVSNPYGKTGKSVSEVALQYIEKIYMEELKPDERVRLAEAIGIEKIEVILESLENEPYYKVWNGSMRAMRMYMNNHK